METLTLKRKIAADLEIGPNDLALTTNSMEIVSFRVINDAQVNKQRFTDLWPNGVIETKGGNTVVTVRKEQKIIPSTVKITHSLN